MRYTSLRLSLPLILLGMTMATSNAADPASPQPIAKLPGPAGTDVAFSRDGKYILTAGGDEARVWDATTFEPITPALSSPNRKTLLLAVVSPAGDLVVTAAGDEAWAWDARTGEKLSAFKHRDRVRTASFSADSARVVTGGDDRNSVVWEARTGRRIASREHTGPVATAVFSPDGATVAAQILGPEPDQRDLGGEVEAWDAATGQTRWRHMSDLWPAAKESTYFRRWASPLAFSPDGRRLAMIHFRNVEVADARTGRTVAWVDTMDVAGPALCLTFSQDGSRLVVGTRVGAAAYDSAPALVEPKDPKRPIGLEQAGKTLWDPSWIGQADVSSDGTRALWAIVGGIAPSVAVTDLTTGQTILELPEHGDALPAAALSPDGRLIAAGFPSDNFTGVWLVPDPKTP